ncbi:MAG: hypothetical protein ABSE77_04725 [Acidimicrobiales bacterium]
MFDPFEQLAQGGDDKLSSGPFVGVIVTCLLAILWVCLVGALGIEALGPDVERSGDEESECDSGVAVRHTH